MSAAHGSAPAAHEAPHEPVFAGAALARLEALYPKFPTRQGCLLPALWIVQEERGWISPGAMAEVAERLG
jgi:NADH:ubiquinone oxidoreductase subunit E